MDNFIEISHFEDFIKNSSFLLKEDENEFKADCVSTFEKENINSALGLAKISSNIAKKAVAARSFSNVSEIAEAYYMDKIKQKVEPEEIERLLLNRYSSYEEHKDMLSNKIYSITNNLSHERYGSAAYVLLSGNKNQFPYLSNFYLKSIHRDAKIYEKGREFLVEISSSIKKSTIISSLQQVVDKKKAEAKFFYCINSNKMNDTHKNLNKLIRAFGQDVINSILFFCLDDGKENETEEFKAIAPNMKKVFESLEAKFVPHIMLVTQKSNKSIMQAQEIAFQCLAENIKPQNFDKLFQQPQLDQIEQIQSQARESIPMLINKDIQTLEQYYNKAQQNYIHKIPFQKLGFQSVNLSRILSIGKCRIEFYMQSQSIQLKVEIYKDFEQAQKMLKTKNSKKQIIEQQRSDQFQTLSKKIFYQQASENMFIMIYKIPNFKNQRKLENHLLLQNAIEIMRTQNNRFTCQQIENFIYRILYLQLQNFTKNQIMILTLDSVLVKQDLTEALIIQEPVQLEYVQGNAFLILESNFRNYYYLPSEFIETMCQGKGAIDYSWFIIKQLTVIIRSIICHEDIQYT